MSIRIAEQTDCQPVRDITVKTLSEIYVHYYPKGAVEFFLEHHNKENITEDIRQGHVFLCVDNKENAVGTVTIKNNEMCRLFVLPQYQGRGYGSEMLDYAEGLIFQKYDKIVLDSSLPAKQIYLKRGYCPIESHCIKANYGDYLCYDVMEKGKLY